MNNRIIRSILIPAIVLLSAKQLISCTVALEEKTAVISQTKNIEVPVNFTLGENEQVCALQFDICFDPSKISFVNALSGEASKKANKEFLVNSIDENTVRVIIYGPNRDVIDNGTLARISLNLPEKAKPGSIPLLIKNITVCDPDAQLIDSFNADSVVIVEAGVADDLSELKVYPNPFKPSKGHSGVVFLNVTQDAKLKIFTITGELVREIDEQSNGTIVWDGSNDSGKKVASGLYVYTVTDLSNNKKTGRIAVVR